MSLKKTKNEKYIQDYLKIKVSLIQVLFLYLERKKCYNSKLNVTCYVFHAMWVYFNIYIYIYIDILGYVQIS